MRIILRTIDLPGKSAALYRLRKSPIVEVRCVRYHPDSVDTAMVI